MSNYRKTTQPLPPKIREPGNPGEYDIYPTYPLGNGKIVHGFLNLATHLIGHSQIVIDGYSGVLWENFRNQLDQALHNQGVQAQWISVEKALRPVDEIRSLVEPYLGGDDPIFGTRFTGTLAEFFGSLDKSEIEPSQLEVMIYYGTGAALFIDNAYLVFVDIPKNEIQYRARAGSINNLGATQVSDPAAMYKRFYFVDWVVLNAHKVKLLPKIDLFVDAQDSEMPTIISGDNMRQALTEMSHNYFRVRPWFEPGPWGGQWMKEHIPRLAKNVPNYAWSFEMIAPEQGIMLESDANLLEEGEGWQVFHLPTHPSHFYDVHRIEFNTCVSIRNNGSPHLLMLVEGTSLQLETPKGKRQRFNYAETFVVPAASDTYTLINEGMGLAKVVKAYLKPDWKEQDE